MRAYATRFIPSWYVMVYVLHSLYRKGVWLDQLQALPPLNIDMMILPCQLSVRLLNVAGKDGNQIRNTTITISAWPSAAVRLFGLQKNEDKLH